MSCGAVRQGGGRLLRLHHFFQIDHLRLAMLIQIGQLVSDWIIGERRDIPALHQDPTRTIIIVDTRYDIVDGSRIIDHHTGTVLRQWCRVTHATQLHARM